MMNLRSITTHISLLCSLAITTAKAEDVARTHDMGDIVVSGSQIDKEIIPVQSLSGETLERLNTHSVADALRYFSGVQIKDYGGVGGLKTVNIRSLGSNHVGVFYDGIELGNAQNGVVDLGRFSLDNMEAVSMYNGQKSSIFQSAKDYASANTIYMTTRKPRFDDDGKDFNLNAGVKAGSFKSVNPSLLWEQRLTNRLRSSVSAEYLYTSGEYKFTYSKADGYDTTEMRKNGDVRYLRGEAALFGDIERGEWQTKIYWYNSERGYPGAAVRSEPGLFINQDRQWDNNLFVQGSLRRMLSDWYSMKVYAKYSNDYLRYLADPREDVSTMYVDNTYKQQEGYASWINMFSVAKWISVAVATDVQYNTLDADVADFAYPQRFTSLTSLASSVDYKRLKAQVSLLYTYVHDKTEGKAASAEDLSRFTPTLVMSYKLLRDIDLSLRAFYKRVFRMPTLNDLYYTNIGYSALLPEYTNQYNIGVTYALTPIWQHLQHLEVQVDAYYNEVENKIVATPTSNQFRWTMKNLGYVEIRGVDFAADAQWIFGEVGIASRATYTYQKAQNFTDHTSEYYGGQIPYIPWHSGSLILGAEWRGWGLNYSFIYTGERYSSEANIPENYSLAWYTSDISLTKTFSIKGVDLRTTAEVNNILNQQYEVVQWYPMPGINFNFKINVII